MPVAAWLLDAAGGPLGACHSPTPRARCSRPGTNRKPRVKNDCCDINTYIIVHERAAPPTAGFPRSSHFDGPAGALSASRVCTLGRRNITGAGGWPDTSDQSVLVVSQSGQSNAAAVLFSAVVRSSSLRYDSCSKSAEAIV
jgi:hypothetical protein